MATVYDVAKSAGVSIATVSRVFNDSERVSQRTLAKVREAAVELGYTPNLAARSLMIKRTDTIGVVLPDMHGEFFSELVRGIDSTARRDGLHMLVSSSHDNKEDMVAALSSMKGRVDGIVIMSPLIDVKTLGKYISDDVPVVVVNGNNEEKRFPRVSVDNFGGAYQMTQYLIEQEYRNICVIGGPSNNNDAEQRRHGCMRALEESPEGPTLDFVSGHFTEESGYKAGKNILAQDQLPDAIFALNDDMAIGCLSALDEAGLSIPKDVAIAGFDDIPLSRCMRPSLTTVHTHIYELGERAVEVLLERSNSNVSNDADPEQIVEASLVIRASTSQC
jgi:LacI family transcriptional regulator